MGSFRENFTRLSKKTSSLRDMNAVQRSGSLDRKNGFSSPPPPPAPSSSRNPSLQARRLSALEKRTAFLDSMSINVSQKEKSDVANKDTLRNSFRAGCEQRVTTASLSKTSSWSSLGGTTSMQQTVSRVVSNPSLRGRPSGSGTLFQSVGVNNDRQQTSSSVVKTILNIEEETDGNAAKKNLVQEKLKVIHLII